MSESGNPLERILDSAARKLVGGSIHPIELLNRVQSAYEANVNQGTAPNRVLVAFNPEDHAAFRDSMPQLRQSILGLLTELEARRGYARVGDLNVAFESSDFVPAGKPRIEVQFVATANNDRAPVRGNTRRIVRHRNLAFVLQDGTRVAVSHTPFSIGRGPGNDLVLPSMSVSRNHAELIRVDDGFMLQDMGSRNGLVVDGNRYEEVVMRPGLPVIVGDITLRLERTE